MIYVRARAKTILYGGIEGSKTIRGSGMVDGGRGSIPRNPCTAKDAKDAKGTPTFLGTSHRKDGLRP